MYHQLTEFARITREMKRLCRERGFAGDIFGYQDDLPDCAPTLELQLAIIDLMIDARPRGCSESGKRLLARLAKGAVLGEENLPDPVANLPEGFQRRSAPPQPQRKKVRKW